MQHSNWNLDLRLSQEIRWDDNSVSDINYSLVSERSVARDFCDRQRSDGVFLFGILFQKYWRYQ